MTRLTAKIYGTVQGVFFREKTEALAKNLGLTGFAKNLPDGTVKIVAEGDEVYLQQLLEWCHHGPGSAKVEKVESTFQVATSEFEGFKVE